MGQIGLGVVSPGRMALITGSSHVLIGQIDQQISGDGFFGAFTDAVVPGQYTVEGGQVSTGSVLKWFTDNFCAEARREAERRGVSAYDVLNERAATIPPGCEGLVVNEYWQGNRTPYTDPRARGIVWGLTLRHTPEHVSYLVADLRRDEDPQFLFSGGALLVGHIARVDLLGPELLEPVEEQDAPAQSASS